MVACSGRNGTGARACFLLTALRSVPTAATCLHPTVAADLVAPAKTPPVAHLRCSSLQSHRPLCWLWRNYPGSHRRKVLRDECQHERSSCEARCLQNTRRAGTLPISVNAAAVMAASTALSRKQPAGGAVGHLPPPPPHGGAAEVSGRIVPPRRRRQRRRPRRAGGATWP